MRQVAGRIERVCENKQQPIIIDFVDTLYSQEISSKEQRLNFYVYRKMRIFEKSA
jgi:hypothetical protein